MCLEKLRRDRLAFDRATHYLVVEGKAAFDQQYLVAGAPVNTKTDVLREIYQGNLLQIVEGPKKIIGQACSEKE